MYFFLYKQKTAYEVRISDWSSDVCSSDLWLLQEITMRLPGREWKVEQAQPADVAALAELLHETALAHDSYEKTHGKHNWWDWYAPYFKIGRASCRERVCPYV